MPFVDVATSGPFGRRTGSIASAIAGATGGGEGAPGRGEGLRVRLARIPGETPKGVLHRPIILPAVLNTFGWTEEFLHSEYGTVRDGQFSQPAMGPPAARQLRTLDDIETLTIAWDPPWLVQQGQDPDDVYRQLFAIGRSKRAVELLATLQFGPQRPMMRTNITIRSISPLLKQGEADSMYYTVRISEWRDASGKRRGEGRGSAAKLPTTHKLTTADTLSSLSQHYYHSHKHWRAIAHANGIHGFGASTALVKYGRYKVGSKIKIPKVG